MPTFTARWVLPVAGPPLAGGTVTVDGPLIAAVEPRGVRAAEVDLGNVAIIPGLVNAHTHLDLSGARGQTLPTDAAHFTDWLKSVIAYRRSRTPDEVQADVRAGLAECLASGTTLIGDIAAGRNAGYSSHPRSRHTAAYSPEDRCLRVVEFEELIGLDPIRIEKRLESEWAWAWHEDGRLQRYRVSLHAPYSVAADAFRRAAVSPPVADPVVVAIHLAETPGELELMTSRTGPFVEFLEALGVWRPEAIAASATWVVEQSRHSPNPTVFAHCNYLPPDTPFGPNQSVVYCPRTHAAFGHPPHPFRDFLARGVRVCLGTDGLTSNPDLDILAEARFVATKYPGFPGDQLLRMVTLSGAEALGWADECGSLEVGKSADFVAVPLPDRDGDPYGLLFAEDCGERRTWFRGTERM